MVAEAGAAAKSGAGTGGTHSAGSLSSARVRVEMSQSEFTPVMRPSDMPLPWLRST